QPVWLVDSRGGRLDRGDKIVIESHRWHRLPFFVACLHTAAFGRIPRERHNLSPCHLDLLIVHPAEVKGESRFTWHDVDDPRTKRDLTHRANRPVTGSASYSLDLNYGLGGDDTRIVSRIHRCRAGMIRPTLNRDVGMDVAGNSTDDSDARAGIFKNLPLLYVELDPADEVLEDVMCFPPILRPIAGRRGMLPERTAVVSRPNPLAKVFFGDRLGNDPASEQQLPEPRTLFFKEADDLQGELET